MKPNYDATIRKLIECATANTAANDQNQPPSALHQIVGQVHGNVFILGGPVTESALELILKAQRAERER